MNLTFHRLVQRDLNEVLAYYESVGGRKLADSFFDEVSRVVQMIEERPTSFHTITHGLRRANLTTFPYHLIFREKGNSVRVLVLRHHRRQPDFGTRRT